MNQDLLSPLPFHLHGECALITGGGSGLGLAMAQCMAAAGARVVLVGRDESRLSAAVQSIGPAACHVAHDVTDLAAAPDLVCRSEAAAGADITILVNNAGIHVKKRAEETSPEDFQSVLTTHLCAAHALNRALILGMKERGHGVILFTASMASLIGIPLVVAYSAAKAAYLGVTRSLAAELSYSGIRVNAIAPGWIESPMLRQALASDKKRTKKILGRTPMGRFGEPEDIGWAAVYLASPAAKFVTGVCLPVDGGASIGF
jgi:NAD(P)-dependent dehydrogenase (short-subunit alcohol dehydrogenase family)